jgi:hypothetical protein
MLWPPLSPTVLDQSAGFLKHWHCSQRSLWHDTLFGTPSCPSIWLGGHFPAMIGATSTTRCNSPDILLVKDGRKMDPPSKTGTRTPLPQWSHSSLWLMVRLIEMSPSMSPFFELLIQQAVVLACPTFHCWHVLTAGQVTHLSRIQLRRRSMGLFCGIWLPKWPKLHFLCVGNSKKSKGSRFWGRRWSALPRKRFLMLVSVALLSGMQLRRRSLGLFCGIQLQNWPTLHLCVGNSKKSKQSGFGVVDSQHFF